MESKKQTLERNLKQCQMLLDKIGIPYGEVAEINVNSKAKSRWGQCKVLAPGKYEIEISERLLQKGVSQKALWDTLLHELLHTAPGCMNHGSLWKKYAARVNAWGYEIETSTSSHKKHIPEDPTEFRYRITCERCGAVSRYRVKSKIVRLVMDGNTGCSCGRCGSYDLKAEEIKLPESEPVGEILRKVAHTEKKTGGDMYTTKEGKTLNGSNMISKSRQEYMLENGWEILHVENLETSQDAYDRLAAKYPGRIIRIYSATTAVRGYYSKYAMMKWAK